MSAPHCETCTCSQPVWDRYLVWDPEYDEDAKCACGHPYYRHFDTYENMLGIGCKYCLCGRFVQTLKPFWSNHGD